MKVLGYRGGTKVKQVLISLVGLISFFAIENKSIGQSNDAVLIFFGAPHCRTCRMMKPLLASLEVQGTPVRQVDVLEEPYFASRYGIRKTPTFIVLIGEKEVTRLVGVHTLDQINRALSAPRRGKLVPTRAIPRDAGDSPVRPRHPSTLGQVNLHIEPRIIPSQTASSTFKFTPLEETEGAWGEVMPSRTAADAIERARAATVRLRVFDATGYGIGTGTIIDTQRGESLILTCGHLFRDAGINARVEVDVFHGGRSHTLEGRLIDFDATVRDIALVTIKSHLTFTPVKIRGSENPTRSGESVFSFGCSRGALPSRFDTRITGVNKYDQHLGLSNLEIHGAPVDGRSGGGLFDQQGRLVGVCSAADYRGDVGIYAGTGAVAWQLERIGINDLSFSHSRKD